MSFEQHFVMTQLVIKWFFSIQVNSIDYVRGKGVGGIVFIKSQFCDRME